MEDKIEIENFLKNLSNTAPEIITRQKIKEITGGLISPKSLANADSAGDGITPRFRIGGKVAYPKDAVIAYIRARCKSF